MVNNFQLKVAKTLILYPSMIHDKSNNCPLQNVPLRTKTGDNGIKNFKATVYCHLNKSVTL